MHPTEVRAAALRLVATGHSDAEVARELGVPRRTVHDWRRHPRGDTREVCARCWRPTSPVRLSAGDYAELLGLYLGDGHISQLARTERLRLMLDAKYPVIVDDAAALLARVTPRNVVGRQLRHEGRMVTLRAHHRHWSRLLPQHGPGKKHDRPMALEPWQQELVDAAPWSLLRGLIRSDGCVFVSTCERVGVQCRVYERHVRIYRRASVALMLQHVGRKQ